MGTVGVNDGASLGSMGVNEGTVRLMGLHSCEQRVASSQQVIVPKSYRT